MNPDGLADSGGRPVRIALGNAVDGLIQDINEFALRRGIGVQTINLCAGILGAGSRRRADPSVRSNNRDMIGDWIAVRRTSEVRHHSSDLVVFRQLVPV